MAGEEVQIGTNVAVVLAMALMYYRIGGLKARLDNIERNIQTNMKFKRK